MSFNDYKNERIRLGIKSPGLFWFLIFAVLLSAFYMWVIITDTQWFFRVVSGRLDINRVEMLCESMSIPESNKLCDGKGTVYALDFVTLIEDEYSESTYNELHEKLGEFSRGRGIGRDGNKTWVLYDIVGKGPAYITVYYNEDMSVDDIFFSD